MEEMHLTRDEVQRMIDYTVASIVLPAIAQLETRIVGIDGNGSGRPGVLQRQDVKLEKMDEKLEMLVNRSQSWDKKNVLEIAKWILGGLGVLFANWLAHRFWS